MFSCCSAPKHTKLWTGGLCFVGALLCLFAIGPVYVGILATPVDDLVDCGQCATDYATYVINEVNGTAIVDKINKAHEAKKDFHRRSGKPDVCITEEDLDGLNLDKIDIDPFPKTCIDKCAPFARKAPLAMACGGATCFAAIVLLVCSLGAFFSFCCCNPSDLPTYVMVDNRPSTSHGSIPHPPTGTATSYDAVKQPLMPEQ